MKVRKVMENRDDDDGKFRASTEGVEASTGVSSKRY